MLGVALDMIVMVLEQQIRILSGAAASDPADSGLPMRRRRHRKTRSTDGEKSQKAPGGLNEQGKAISKAKGRSRARKKMRQETGAAGPANAHAEQDKPDDVENNVLTLVSVGYETVSSGLNADGTV